MLYILNHNSTSNILAWTPRLNINKVSNSHPSRSAIRIFECPNNSNNFCIWGQHDTKTILMSSDTLQFTTAAVPVRSDFSGEDLRGEQRSGMSVDAEVLLSPWMSLTAAGATRSFFLRSLYTRWTKLLVPVQVQVQGFFYSVWKDSNKSRKSGFIIITGKAKATYKLVSV